MRRRVASVPTHRGGLSTYPAPRNVWIIGCLIVLAGTLMMIAGLTWGAGRLNKNEPTESKTQSEPTARV